MNKNRKNSEKYNEHFDLEDEDESSSEDNNKNYDKFETFKRNSTITNNEKNQSSNKNMTNKKVEESSEEEKDTKQSRTTNKKSTNIGVNYVHNIEKLDPNFDEEEQEEEESEDEKEKKILPKSNNLNKQETIKYTKLPKFDISTFSNINAGSDVKELFSVMKKFEPKEYPVESKLKPFIPNYIPSIGEVDAFLKMNRPDTLNEDLGTFFIDEPIINGIDPSIFSLELAYTLKTKPSNFKIKSIEEAEKNPNKIQNWIDQISNLHRDKVSSSVNYSKPMPNIESLMQIWPENFEESLKGINLPEENINLSLESYASMVCNILDIPVHKLNSNKSIIEALHVFFSLYSEFKHNQHFQMQNNKKTEENIQTKKFY